MIAAPVNRRQILRYAPRVMRGRHQDLAIATLMESTRMRVTTRTPLIVEADGEIRDREATRVDVMLLPGALSLLT